MREYRQIYKPRLAGIYMPDFNISIATERSLQDYSWYDAKKELLKTRHRMPSLAEFVAFLDILRYGNDEMQATYKDVVEVREPVRACWLNAFFVEKKNDIYMQVFNFNGGTVEEKLDEDTLMHDEIISLDSWLANLTKQGLPKKDARNGSLSYWCPINKSVAGFSTFSVGADLDCSRSPQESGSALGIFKCAEGMPA